MLARAIILGISFLAGSTIADSVLEARNITTANITVAADGGNLTFTTVTRVVNATYAYNVTEDFPTATAVAVEAFPTATAVAVEAWNNTWAPTNTSTACFCSITATIIATENQTIAVPEPTLANITVTVLPTSAVTNNATTCPCQVVGTNQTILPTTQSVGAATVGETGAQSNNLLLNTNSGIMEIASIQLAAISIFFGLVGAGVTLI